MMGRQRSLAHLVRNESGVAAIEMALVLPLLLLLFFAMIDVTTLLSDNRRLSYSANAVADLVSRLESPTTPEKIADAFKAAELVMRSAQPDPVRVEVYLFRKVGLNAVQQWVRTNNVGQACSSPVRPSASSLMAAGNDIIIAVTCATFKPVLARLTGDRVKFVGKVSFNLREQIAVRPRFSLLLDCPNNCVPTPP